jgi:hypothetical protein
MFMTASRNAPSAKSKSPRARSRPQLARGGTRAVAIATPTKATLSRGEIDA